MHYGQPGVMFDREPAIRRGNEESFTHPTEFLDEACLCGAAANMLYDCVAEYDIKCIVIERQLLSGSHTQVLQTGVLLLKMGSIFCSHACDPLWERV